MLEQPSKKATVLIIDDHKPAAEMLKRIFEVRGYDTYCVFDGQTGYDEARKIVPDLILLDVMMPGIDGFETLKLLQEDTTTTRIPVIFITARDEPADIEHGLNIGADDYIPKPVEPRELLARAKSKIEARRLKNELEQRTTDLTALLRFSEELNNQLQLDELLDLILYLILDLTPSLAAIIGIENEDGQFEQHVRTKHEDSQIDLDSKALLQQIRDSSSPIVWNTADTTPPFGMAVEMIHGEQSHGILAVLGEHPFQSNHVLIFEGIGRQTTLALRNAELYTIKAQYADHLEEMVNERTQELRSAQALLVQAEKLASVGRLSAGIAHEINNPLMPIRVNLELMAEDLQDNRPINPQDIEESLHSVRRISRIVERLQQFTRKRGTDIPTMEAVPIMAVIDDVLALSKAYIRQSGIKVQMEIENQSRIYGNRDQLEQVFLNLVLNAIAAMESGGTLTIRNIIKKGKSLIEFEDTGTGIKPDVIDQIFEPFISTKENGSGLGLFISYGIIQDHNGTIEVQSEVGKGTLFTITLPLMQE